MGAGQRVACVCVCEPIHTRVMCTCAMGLQEPWAMDVRHDVKA